MVVVYSSNRFVVQAGSALSILPFRGSDISSLHINEDLHKRTRRISLHCLIGTCNHRD